MRAVLRIELVSGTGRDVGLKTIEPATRLSGGAMGNSSLVGVQAGRLNEFLKLSVGDNRRGLPLLATLPGPQGVHLSEPARTPGLWLES